MQISFARSRMELVNPTTHATVCPTEGKNGAFLGGSWAGCLESLCSFSTEQLSAAHNCTISRLSSPGGRSCTIFSMKSDKKICTILEPSRLLNKIAQFLKGRLVSLQNCAICWGICSACSWTKCGDIAYEGGCNKIWWTSYHSPRKSVKLVYLTRQDMLLWKVGREAPKWS